MQSGNPANVWNPPLRSPVSLLQGSPNPLQGKKKKAIRFPPVLKLAPGNGKCPYFNLLFRKKICSFEYRCTIPCAWKDREL